MFFDVCVGMAIRTPLHPLTACIRRDRSHSVEQTGVCGCGRLHVEESQLVFGGHRASIDSVKLINEDHFVTGS